MDIIYTITHNYVEVCAVSMVSAIMNNLDMPITFHIITANFTDDDYEYLNSVVASHDNIEIKYYDLANYDIEKYGIPNWRGNQIANARIFFQDIIDVSNLSHLLYLDADTIVVNSLSELSNYKGAINGVLESVFNYRLENLGLKRYFNSGVLFFDVEKWFEGDFQRRIIDYRTKNPNLILDYPDQDLINLAIGTETSVLPLRYNLPTYALIERCNFSERYYHNKRRYDYDVDVKTERDNAVIYHSCGFLDIKPWMENKVNPLNKYFEEYMELVDPNFNKEKLKGLKNFLINHPNLFYIVLEVKQNLAPDKVLKLFENYSTQHKKK